MWRRSTPSSRTGGTYTIPFPKFAGGAGLSDVDRVSFSFSAPSGDASNFAIGPISTSTVPSGGSALLAFAGVGMAVKRRRPRPRKVTGRPQNARQ